MPCVNPAGAARAAQTDTVDPAHTPVSNTAPTSNPTQRRPANPAHSTMPDATACTPPAATAASPVSIRPSTIAATVTSAAAHPIPLSLAILRTRNYCPPEETP